MNEHGQRISSMLREDGQHYSFDDLRDRFDAGLVDADECGDDWVTIKIPSSHEFTVRAATVAAALGRNRR